MSSLEADGSIEVKSPKPSSTLTSKSTLNMRETPAKPTPGVKGISEMVFGPPGLLDLPTEILDMVYKLVIHEEYHQLFWPLHESVENNVGIWLDHRRKEPVLQPAISKVCRDMRKHALSIFWRLPRTSYPSFDNLFVDDLEALRAARSGQGTQLAPLGSMHLKTFNMYWCGQHGPKRGGRNRRFAVNARVYVHKTYPAGTVVLKTSYMCEHVEYDDGILLDLLLVLNMRADTRRLDAADNRQFGAADIHRLDAASATSARRWSFVKFASDDVHGVLQHLHWDLCNIKFNFP